MISSAANNLDYFECINTSDKAYWLGFIAADGYLYKDKKQAFLRIALSSIDSDHLLKLSNIFGKNVNFISHVDKRTGKKYNQCRLTVFGNELYKDLMYHSESFIDVLFYINPSLHSHFIRGYFDGDGTVGIDSNNLIKFGFCSPDLDFLKCIMDIVCFNTDLKPIKILKIRDKNCYEFRWHGKNISISFYNWLYSCSDTYLKRKKDVFFNYFIRNEMISI